MTNFWITYKIIQTRLINHQCYSILHGYHLCLWPLSAHKVLSCKQAEFVAPLYRTQSPAIRYKSAVHHKIKGSLPLFEQLDNHKHWVTDQQLHFQQLALCQLAGPVCQNPSISGQPKKVVSECSRKWPRPYIIAKNILHKHHGTCWDDLVIDSSNWFDVCIFQFGLYEPWTILIRAKFKHVSSDILGDWGREKESSENSTYN